MLIAIEGIDGAGKVTVAAGLVEHLKSTGHPVRLISFPRYQETAAGRLIGGLLGARDGDIGRMSVEFLATLFAEDRRQSAELLAPQSPDEILICDRFTASNAAFQCGRLPPARHADFIAWLEDLEFTRFGTRRPDLNIWLDVPPKVSRELVARKAKRSYTDDTHDVNEADTELQDRAAAAYRLMSESGAMGAWARIEVAPGNALRAIEDVRAEAIEVVERSLSV